jgi:hypothetical protein
MYRSHRDDSDQLLVCLVWSLDESFRVPVDLSLDESFQVRIVDVFFYLYLPNPRSHVLSPLLCLSPREERKNKVEKRGEMRAYRRPSSSFLSKNWWWGSGSYLVPFRILGEGK